MFDEVLYEFRDERDGQRYVTNLFPCLGITRAGDRCQRYVSDELFCKSHMKQAEQLDKEFSTFFRIKTQNGS